MPPAVTCIKLTKEFQPGGSVTTPLREQVAAMPGFSGASVAVAGPTAQITLPRRTDQEEAVLRQTLVQRLSGWRLAD